MALDSISTIEPEWAVGSGRTHASTTNVGGGPALRPLHATSASDASAIHFASLLMIVAAVLASEFRLV
jgi:hypothetical protein